jgi:hypothetical protein
MTSCILFYCLRTYVLNTSLLVLVAIGLIGPSAMAQGPVPDAPMPSGAPSGAPPAATGFVVPTTEGSQHKFWDTENKVLFATAFALDGADFAVTRANLQNGGRELNPMVRVFGRSLGGLAVNFAGEGVGTVALSYFFHRTGHHRMERIVSYVNIGGSAGAVTYGLKHHR